MDLKYHAEQKHLIYSSGKCGTSTVATIPNIGSIDIDPLTYAHSVNTVHNVIKSKTPIETLTIIIREPRARFNSGLFETVGKGLMYTVLRTAIVDNNIDLINHMVNLYYRDDFWHDIVYAFIRPKTTKHSMLASKEMNMRIYQFHFGNWLTTVSKIMEIAKTYGIKVEIVDTTNLSQYLTDKNYQFTVKNVQEYNTTLTSNPAISGAVNEVDTVKAYHAFKKACECCYPEIINEYLKPEIELYNKLIAMSKT